MRRNAFCCVRVVKRDDLTDMIAAAADYIPRSTLRHSVIIRIKLGHEAQP
jgi:hypothetical protein